MGKKGERKYGEATFFILKATLTSYVTHVPGINWLNISRCIDFTWPKNE